MTNSASNSQSDRERLEGAISALEAQRAILGDDATDAAIGSLKRDLAELRSVRPNRKREKEGERRVVTILFSDVVGSTAMAEQLDPEEWTEIMNAAFERLIEPVERFGGTIARLMGDAILAFFGAPIAHEDDPQRAILAGLAIVHDFEPFQQQLRNEKGLQFNVRVGINTGLAVVGDVGSETATEYTAMGDAVNLAARMEQTAEPGTVQIAETTYRLVAPLFEIESLGKISVKGKAAAVHSYKVLNRKVRPGRTRGIEGLDAPLIGRQREMSLLADLTTPLAKQNSGAIVTLTGEAGLGKSRLIREMRKTANPEYQWYEAACLSYERNQPYSLIKRLIRRMIGMNPGDSIDQLRDRLMEITMIFPGDEQAEIGHMFESLFGLEGHSDQPAMEGEAFQKRLYRAMTTIFEKYVEKAPTIIVYDDLHWADSASIALLKHLMSLVVRWPFLILLSMRPEEKTYGWELLEWTGLKFGQLVESIKLHPLNKEEGSLLVDSLLTISDIPQHLRTLILERTDGNPFFVEEVVRSLIDDGFIVREGTEAHWKTIKAVDQITIPDNVQSLLAARIDRLEATARTTLQLASVVGRSFYYRVLNRIVDLVEDLNAELSALQQAQFIEEASRQPELSYIFRHALTQEAAYNAILLRQRRVYHQRVGETLESLFSDRLEEFAASLAYHFYQAQDYERALKYYTMAGDMAYRLYAFVEAIEHYTQAIECLDRVEAVTSQLLIKLYIRRGRAYKLDNHGQKAMENYHKLMELAEKKDDKSLRLASLTAQATLLSSGFQYNNPTKAKELGREALSLARELGDRAAEARALWNLLLAEKWGGDFDLALDYGQQSLKIARELKLTKQIGYTLHNMAEIYMFKEDFEAVKQANIGEREAWLEVGNTPMMADSYLVTSGINLYAGDYSAAIDDANAADRISRSIGYTQTQSVAPFYSGLALLDQGNYGQALRNFERGVQIAESEDLTMFKNGGYSHQILVYCSIGALKLADSLADRAYQVRDQLPYGFFTMILTRIAQDKIANDLLDQAQVILLESIEGLDPNRTPPQFMVEALLTKAQLHLALGNPNEALTEINRLKILTKKAVMKNQLPWRYLLEGNSLLALLKIESASEVLNKGVSLAEQIGHRRLLWQLLISLSDVETKLGRQRAANSARAKSREVISYISEHIGDEDLRETFLGRPDVQLVTRL